MESGHRGTIQLVDYSVPLEPDFVRARKKVEL
jgi:hypothetical protein